MMEKIRPAIAVLLGLGILAVTIWLTITGVTHPTAARSISIALFSAIGVPIALGIISYGYRQYRGPNSSTLKTEGEAKRRAAAALEDAETAERIQAELDAYVAIRSWRLEIERRRGELSTARDSLMQSLRELNEMETQLGVKLTEISPTTQKTLDAILGPQPRVTVPGLDVWGVPVGELTNKAIKYFYDHRERRRLKRMATLAPEAMRAPDVQADHSSPSQEEHPPG